jgi:hypothetical protein
MKIKKGANSHSPARRRFIRSLFFVQMILASLVPAVHRTYAGSATWSLNPTSGNWNKATNWTPATVPNGPNDTASFEVFSTTNVSLLGTTLVEGIVFDAGASAFTVATTPGRGLTISASGITNNSGVTQNFVTALDNSTNRTQDIVFTNSATAGSLTLFTNNGAGAEGRGRVLFFNSASADNGTFINNAFPPGGVGGITEFHDNSSASNGSFTNNGGPLLGGETHFYDSSNAGSATFTTTAGVDFSRGFVVFEDTSSAASGTFITNGGAADGEWDGGEVLFLNSSTADHGTFIINGATFNGAGGGEVTLEDTSIASDATFIANGPSVAGGGEARSILREVQLQVTPPSLLMAAKESEECAHLVITPWAAPPG